MSCIIACEIVKHYIHGLNPKLPEQSILQVEGEILMEENNYRVGGVNSPIEVGTTFWYRHPARFLRNSWRKTQTRIQYIYSWTPSWLTILISFKMRK